MDEDGILYVGVIPFLFENYDLLSGTIEKKRPSSYVRYYVQIWNSIPELHTFFETANGKSLLWHVYYILNQKGGTQQTTFLLFSSFSSDDF